jgi:nucleoside-diphosphate-sugar epimerase
MKVLVTGGTGFIGQYVCEELDRRGYHVLKFDRHARAEDATLDMDLFLGDVIDDVSVTEAFAHCDAFIHLAAVLGTQETITNPRPAAKSNLLGGLNVLEAAAQYSTPGVYIGVGNHWMNNTYSITKTMIERFIDMFNKDRGTQINIVRAMNAYGPRQVPAAPYGPAKVRKITPSFVCRALMGHNIEIYGDGKQVSDMIYVTDVAHALVNAMEKALEGSILPPIEIGPKINNTVNEVAELIVKLSKSDSVIKHLPMRPGEIPNSIVSADCDTLKLINMTTESLIPINIGMKLTINYFRDYLKNYQPQ